jgi:hypothetical protein
MPVFGRVRGLRGVSLQGRNICAPQQAQQHTHQRRAICGSGGRSLPPGNNFNSPMREQLCQIIGTRAAVAPQLLSSYPPRRCASSAAPSDDGIGGHGGKGEASLGWRAVWKKPEEEEEEGSSADDGIGTQQNASGGDEDMQDNHEAAYEEREGSEYNNRTVVTPKAREEKLLEYVTQRSWTVQQIIDAQLAEQRQRHNQQQEQHESHGASSMVRSLSEHLLANHRPCFRIVSSLFGCFSDSFALLLLGLYNWREQD